MEKEKIDKIYRENAQTIYKYLCSLTQDRGLDAGNLFSGN